MLLALRKKLEIRGIDVQALRSEADRKAHDLISQALALSYPSDPILSEEGMDNQARLRSRRVWIIDPLDGTREFAERDRTDWAIHIALVVDEQPVAAVVTLPARGLTLSMHTFPAQRARKAGPLRLLVSRTRPPEIALSLARHLGAELVPMGSAGAKTIAVALTEADLYVHAGGQYEWDSAAPVGVAVTAGLHVSRLDSSPLRYNQPSPWLPDLLVCRRDLAVQVQEALKVCEQEKKAGYK